MSRRVLVIGGGLAGLTAALEATEAGAEVTLLQAGQGAHHLFSGCIDLLAYPAPDQPAVPSPLAAIEELVSDNPDHPYAKTGVETVRAALARFQNRTAAAGVHYLGDGVDQKRVLTALGTLRPTALVPATMAVEPAEIEAVCGLGQYRNFAEGLVAAELSLRTGRDVPALSFAVEKSRHDALGIATRLREPEQRQAFGDYLAVEAPGKTVAIPALLGFEEAEEVKSDIEGRFGGRLVEVPGLPPSLPGLRLMRALRRSALDLGVRFVQGARAVAPMPGVKLLDGLQIRVGNIVREERADAVVLAAGHLVTGGLVSTRGSLREPIFNLPVLGYDGGEFFRPRFLSRAGHPALLAGVPVDADLRPVQGKEPVFQNLYACGDILAGFDPYRERSGGGVALATATMAGRLAAGAVA